MRSSTWGWALWGREVLLHKPSEPLAVGQLSCPCVHPFSPRTDEALQLCQLSLCFISCKVSKPQPSLCTVSVVVSQL